MSETNTDSRTFDPQWDDVYAKTRRRARVARIEQLIFEIRAPEKPPAYDAQRAAEELADLIDAGRLNF